MYPQNLRDTQGWFFTVALLRSYRVILSFSFVISHALLIMSSSLEQPVAKRPCIRDIIDLTLEDYEIKEFEKLCDAVVKADDKVITQFLSERELKDEELL